MKTRLREIRIELGLTQGDMGAETGKSRDVITSYELGRVKPDDTYLMLLHEKYGYNLEWIRTGAGEKKVQTPYWEQGSDFSTKALQQSLEEAKAYLDHFFDGYSDGEKLLLYALLRKKFPNDFPPEESPEE